MRRKLTLNTFISELISSENRSSTTFYIGDVKLCVTTFRLCKICKKYYPQGLMRKIEGSWIDWGCESRANKIEINQQEKDLYSISSKKGVGE